MSPVWRNVAVLEFKHMVFGTNTHSPWCSRTEERRVEEAVFVLKVLKPPYRVAP